MGKVIKGSRESEERYTVAIPAFGVAVPPAMPDISGEIDGALPANPFEADLPVEPEIDLEAIRGQAQAVLDDAERSAQALMDDAQLRARGLIEAATDRAHTLCADATRQGHGEGYSDGLAAAQNEMGEMLGVMRDLLDSTRTERHALLASAEPELVRLAVGIAERVLHQQIALDPGVVVEMARAAVARIVDREKITVRVNPADIDRMREHREELLALGDVKTMRVIEDQRVDRGGVVLETDAGSIDAKIATQLTEARKILHIVDDVVIGPAAPVLALDEGADFSAARAS